MLYRAQKGVFKRYVQKKADRVLRELLLSDINADYNKIILNLPERTSYYEGKDKNSLEGMKNTFYCIKQFLKVVTIGIRGLNQGEVYG
jgi:hypothetical protein